MNVPRRAIRSSPGFWATWLLAAIRFYQAALRPLNPWGCKFYPSCSAYAIEAIETKGALRGLRLALGRLLRCRPGVFGGYDPVPEEDAAQRLVPLARARRLARTS